MKRHETQEEHLPTNSVHFSKEEHNESELDEVGNNNLNKKVKKVIVGEKLRNIKIKSIILIIVFLLIYGASSFGLNIHTSNTNLLVH